MDYWSVHSSLYQHLSRNDIVSIEKAIRLVSLGNYGEARLLFTELEQGHLRNLPITIIECSNWYERTGFESDRIAYLNAVTYPASRNLPLEGADEWDLIELLTFNSMFFARGCLRPNLPKIVAVSRRLGMKAIELLSDVEVHCMLECKRLIHLCKDSSNWLNRTTLSDRLEESPLPTIRRVRQMLQERSRFSEAHFMVKSESLLDNLSGLDEMFPFEDFINTTRARFPGDDIGLSLLSKLSVTRIFYAEDYTDSAQMERGREQIELAKRDFARFASRSGCQVDQFPRFALLRDRALAKIQPSDNIQDRIDGHIDFAQRARAIQDGTVRRVHLQAAMRQSLAQVEAKNAENHSAAAAQHERLLQRYFAFEDEEVDSGYFCLAATNQYATESDRRWPLVFERVQDFLTTFPDFDLPRYLVLLASSGYRAAREVGDEVAVQRFVELKCRNEEQCPWMPSDGTDVDFTHITDDLFYLRWSTGDDFTKKNRDTSTRLVLEWVKQEFNDGTVNAKEARQLLQWDRCFESSSDQVVPEFNHSALNMITPAHVANATFGVPVPVPSSIWAPWFEQLKSWLLRESARTSAYQRHYVLRQFSVLRTSFLNNYSPTATDAAATLFYRKDGVIDSKASWLLHEELSMQYHDIFSRSHLLEAKGSYALSIALLVTTAGAVASGFLTDALVQDAADRWQECCEEYRSIGHLENLLHTMMSLGRLQWTRYTSLRTVSPATCIEYFNEAFEIYAEIRQESAILNPARAFIAKGRQVEKFQVENMFGVALWSTISSYAKFFNENQSASLDSPEGRTHFANMALVSDWIQKGKAKTLTELLGLAGEIPPSMMAEISKHPSALRWLEDEATLLKDVTQTSMSKKAGLRMQLQIMQRQMRTSEPVLRPVLDIRAGITMSQAEVSDFGLQLGSNVIIVDWCYCFAMKAQFWLTTHREGKVCSLNPCLDTTLALLQEWVSENMSAAVPFDPSRKKHGVTNSIAMLNETVVASLVAPLAALTKPGETLILCPTRVMHRIPLHAIKVDSIPLIERNRIVYVQSLSLLRLCRQGTDVATEHTRGVLSATVFNTLGTAADKPVEEIRSILGGKALSTEKTNKGSFKQQSLVSSIIHVHGHIEFEEADPLNHRLCLRESSADPEFQLTANEIFNIKFRRPSIVMAMGCNSGRAKASDSDDLLGLTAAFHYAGASVVISTLWAVRRTDCETFSKAFYAQVKLMLEANDEPVSLAGEGFNAATAAKDVSSASTELEYDPLDTIDLAEAMQKGVGAVRFDEYGDERHPYHWAGFVMHGWWKFPKLKLQGANGDLSNKSV